jgi:hypothetical protein
MKITANRPEGKLIVEGTIIFPISNRVRTLKDGSRKSSEVIRSIPANLPYDPVPFPAGLWRITGVEWQKDRNGKALFDYKVYGPAKIRTDAWQWVRVCELDRDGDYFRERGDEVKDYGYLLHYSVSKTTLGCIRIASPADAEALAQLVEKALKSGEKAELEVI